MLQIALWKRITILLTCAVGLWLAVPNLFYTTVEQHNDAVQAIELGAVTPENEAIRDGWPGWMPSGLVNLGLDLRGGAHLLAEVQVEDVYASRMDAYWPEIRDALRPERATVGTIRLQPSPSDEVHVRISQPEGMQRAIEVVRGLARPVQSITGVGANDIQVRAEGDLLIVSLSDAEKLASDERTVQQSLEIIRRRIDEGERDLALVGLTRLVELDLSEMGGARPAREGLGELRVHPAVCVSGAGFRRQGNDQG